MTDYIQVENVVCVGDLGRTIDRLQVAACLNARFDPLIFPALVSHQLETGAVLSIFSTGKVVIVGCRDEDKGLIAMHLLVRTLWRVMRLRTRVCNFTVCNIVGRIRLPWRLNLNRILTELQESPLTVQANAEGKGGLSYEPEAFPGLTWPIRTLSGITFTVQLFRSGCGAIVGLRNRDHRHVANQILSTLDRFELQQEDVIRELAGATLDGKQQHPIKKRRKLK